MRELPNGTFQFGNGITQPNSGYVFNPNNTYYLAVVGLDTGNLRDDAYEVSVLMEIETPYVFETTPEDNQQGINPSDSIHIYFSDVLDSSAVASAFSLVSVYNDTISGTFVWYDSLHVLFDPNTTLAGDTEYIATLSYTAGIDGNLNGVLENSTVDDYSWNFQTIRPPTAEHTFEGPAHPVTSSLVLADMNGDGENEIIHASSSASKARLYVWHNDGRGAFSGNQTHKVLGSPDRAGKGTPTVGNVDGTSEPEIVFLTEPKNSNFHPDQSRSINVYTLSGEKMTSPLKKITADCEEESPILFDGTADGVLNVVAATDLYYTNNSCTERNGIVGFYDGFDGKSCGDDYFGTLENDWFSVDSQLFGPNSTVSDGNCGAVADVDGNGNVEIYYSTSDNLYIVDPNNVNESSFINLNARYSSPIIIYDINDIGKVLIGYTDGMTGGVKRLNVDGTLDATYSTAISGADGRIKAPLAVGDLNGDGEIEIVAGSEGGTLFIWSYNTTTPRFSYDTGTTEIFSCAAIGDIDEDNLAEVIISSGNDSTYIFGYDSDADSIKLEWQLPGGDDRASVALGNVDSDDFLEFVTFSDSKDTIFVWECPGRYYDGAIQWSQFQGDARHTGVFDLVAPRLPTDWTYEPTETPPALLRDSNLAVLFNWSPSISNDVAGYNLYRATSLSDFRIRYIAPIFHDSRHHFYRFNSYL